MTFTIPYLGDVIFKSFAFSHWLLLVGLGSISASGAIAFSPVGIILLLIGGISSFSLSLSTEGIRMVSTGKAIAKKFNDRVKVALVPGKTVRAPEEMTMLQRFGQLIGNAVAALVSLMTAIPALTSSISKVAGLGAFILWCLPGMQGVAFGLSLGLGLFFCISKFIGYYSQSGPYIINAVSEKTQSFQSSYTDSMQRLMPEPQVKPEVEVAPEPEQARVEAPEQSGVAAKLDSFYRFMTGTKKAPEGASQQARLAI